MTSRKIFALVLLLPALCLRSPSQDGATSSGNADSVAQEAASVPSPLNTGGYPLAFRSEMTRSNYLDAGVTVSGTFDDNVLGTTGNRVSDIGYSALPHIALSQARTRINWMLEYTGGFTFYRRVDGYNQAFHDVGLEADYLITPHLDLVLRDHFTKTTGFFDQINQSPLEMNLGSVLQQPNRFVVAPLANQTVNLGTASLKYQFSPFSAIGISGTYYKLRYRDVPAGSGLLDTQSAEGEAFYNHRLTPRNAVGLTYRFQRLTFEPGSDRTQVDSLLLSDTFSITPHMSVSIFAGPQYTKVTAESIDAVVLFPLILLVPTRAVDRSVSSALGASYEWHGERTTIVASVSRTVSDGGGLLPAVELIGATGGIRRQLTRSLAIEFTGTYGINDVLVRSTSLYPSFNSGIGNINFSRRMGANVGVTVGYSRITELNKDIVPGFGRINRNRAWMSLSYDFSRPLGR